MKRFTLTILILAALTGCTMAQTIYGGFIDGQVYVKVKNQYPVGEFTGRKLSLTRTPLFNKLVDAYGITLIERPFYLKSAPVLGQIYRLNFTRYAKVDELIAELTGNESIEYAEKVPIQEVFVLPDDLDTINYEDGNWALQQINAQQAWEISTGNPAVKIAIVDNAVQTGHIDLVDNIWVNPGEIPGNGMDDDDNGYVDDINGYDLADDDNDPNPDDWDFSHGSHCAGIASATTNNGIGIASIGYNCQIIAVKCARVGSTGSFIVAGYDGIVYSAAAGADIISLSWGGSDSSITEQLIIDAVYDLGIVIFASAGNSGNSFKKFPAGYNHVVSVASTGNGEPGDEKSYFSNFGSWVDIAAPGMDIRSTVPTDNYTKKSGTSMSCPLVAGLAGLLLSVKPDMEPGQVINCILSTADNIDSVNAMHAGKLGAGRINAYNAMQCARQIFMGDYVNVFPNPAAGQAAVEVLLQPQRPFEIRLFDTTGQLIIQYTNDNTGSYGAKYDLPLEGLANGLYFVEVSANNFHVLRKLVVAGH